MNTANLELCQELYALSGWDYESQYVHATDNYSDERAKHLLTRGMLGENPYDPNLKYKFVAPAYDLGYLIRKLPNKIIVEHSSNIWWARHDDFTDKGDISINADTPENALAKLAIELFKQGILTKQGKE